MGEEDIFCEELSFLPDERMILIREIYAVMIVTEIKFPAMIDGLKIHSEEATDRKTFTSGCKIWQIIKLKPDRKPKKATCPVLGYFLFEYGPF